MAQSSGFASSVLSTIQVDSEVCSLQGFGQGHAGLFLEISGVFTFSVHFMCFVSIANNVDKYIRSSELQFLIIGPCEIFASMRFTESLGWTVIIICHASR